MLDIKKKEVEALKLKTPLTHFVDSKRLLKGVRPFKEGISAGGRINLIAEIKKRSPSRRKAFFKELNIPYLAEVYSKMGARAISVLTEERFFGGDISHIMEVKRSVNLPVLRKDFIIDEYQVYESRYFGADAILLIARILTRDKIKSFMHLANRICMDSIVEVHDEPDLEKALLCDAKIIGINNRDIETLEVDFDTTLRLASKMPKELIKISESGIRNREQIAQLRDLGVHAVLIGEAFLEAQDIGARISEIMGDNKICQG